MAEVGVPVVARNKESLPVQVRRRAPHACRRCRRLRTRCIHENADPPCNRCKEAGQELAAECTFSARDNDREFRKKGVKIRERTKDLEQDRRWGSIERMLNRIMEVESENMKLSAQVAVKHTQSPVATGPEIQEEMIITPKASSDWMGEPASSCPWPKAASPQLKVDSEIPSFSDSAPDSIYTPTSSSVGQPPPLSNWETTSSFSFEIEELSFQDRGMGVDNFELSGFLGGHPCFGLM